MQNTSIKIAPLSQTDYSLWLVLWERYLSFYETTLPTHTTEATWDNLLNQDIAIYGFGAWINDTLVGITHVVLHPNTWNTSDCCYLEDLYVSDNARGQGAGRALIEYVYNFAAQKTAVGSIGRRKKETTRRVSYTMPLLPKLTWCNTVKTYENFILSQSLTHKKRQAWHLAFFISIPSFR